MPRKSTASATVQSDTAMSPATAGPAHHEGDTSILSAAATDASPTSKAHKSSSRAEKGDADNLGIDDLLLPRTLTSRLARGTLPPNTSIQKDALLALTKAASVFISYLAAQSNEQTTKKTIGPADVLKAIHEIEMGGVMGLGVEGGGRLERELAVWETAVRGKRKGYRDKVKQRESGVGGESDGGGGGGGGEEGEDGERVAKRARVDEDQDESTFADTEDGGADTTGGLDGGGGAAHPLSPHPDRPRTNGTAAATHDMHDDTQDELDDDDEDDADEEEEEEEEGSAEGDETQPDDEDDEGEGRTRNGDEDEDEVDGYGPDDQLRHDMNGDETGDESD